MPGWDATAYDDVSTIQQAWGHALLDQRMWRGDETVLDAGCGTGRLTLALLKRVPRGRVVAVDRDPAMVAKAKENLASRTGPCEVRHRDLVDLAGLPTFDVIFSNAVLHWILDHGRVFREFKAHLKPGGEFLAQAGGHGNLQRARTVAAHVMASPAFASHFGSWTPPWNYADEPTTRRLLQEAGFPNPNVTLTPAPTPFPNRETFERFTKSVVLWPYLERLPSSGGRDAFVKAFIDGCETSGLGHHLDYVRITIRAAVP